MKVEVLDNAHSIFFQRELEVVKKKTFDVQYQNLKFRELFPVNNEGGKGMGKITTTIFDKVGSAKIISDYADDLPRADAFGKQTSIKIYTIGASFGYSVQEIEISKRLGRSLEQAKANAARRAMEEKLNSIAFNGDSETEMHGIFSHPNIPVSNVINGVSGFPEWSKKTADEILFDVNDMFAEQQELTFEKEKPNKLLLPTQQWNFLAATPRSSVGDTTIMAYLATNSPYLSSIKDIISVPALANAGPSGDDIMIAYDRNPDKIIMEIPVEPLFLPIQATNLGFKVPGYAETAGLNVNFPLSITIKESI